MSTPKSKKPVNWDDYEHGRSPSQGSFTSIVSQNNGPVRVSPSNIAPYQSTRQPGEGEDLRRRRSSITMRISSLRQAGGVNSIDNFARSWQRAAGFPEIAPARRASFLVEGDEANTADREPRDEEEHAPTPHKSLLRQQLESSQGTDAIAEDHDEPDPGVREQSRPIDGRLPSGANNDHFSLAPHLADTLSRSYSTGYGSISPSLNESSKRRASRLFSEQQRAGSAADKERAPLLVKEVQREDGTKTHVIVGQSTLPQTTFNSVNVLIGVGLLSLPLAVKYSGWVIGMLFLFFAAIVTAYTAKLLATCLNVDPTLVTYADIAYISFGPRARIITSLLFSIELVAACVALVVLFADSLNALIPGWSIISWKIFCGVILVPLNFVSLRVLSVTSILGILCAIGMVLIVFIDGIIKPSYPGSLWEPATTYAFPNTWMTLPLSFGLFMSPWGGHSVFPNIYRDMRHPAKYARSLRYTYSFTYLLDLVMAITGVLMFGEHTRDEITSNVLLTRGYPRALSVIVVILIAIIPLTKVPLSCRPIVSTLEILLGLSPHSISSDSRMQGLSPLLRGLLTSFIRLLVIVIIVVISILFPSFDSIMALMGSALCFTICIILPIGFYLKIFWKEISWREWVVDWVLILACSVMAVVGTVWAVLPKEKLGIR